MLRRIIAVKLGGRCASSSAFTLAAVDGASTGMAATLQALLRPPLNCTLAWVPAFAAESGGRPAGAQADCALLLCHPAAMLTSVRLVLRAGAGMRAQHERGAVKR